MRQNGASNGSPKNGVKPKGNAAQHRNGSELDNRIAALQETVGGKLYRWVMREYGHANQPHLVRDIQQKKKILDVLESATRGLRRMESVLDRVPEKQVSALLVKLQAPPLNEIADMPTLVQESRDWRASSTVPTQRSLIKAVLPRTREMHEHSCVSRAFLCEVSR